MMTTEDDVQTIVLKNADEALVRLPNLLGAIARGVCAVKGEYTCTWAGRKTRIVVAK